VVRSSLAELIEALGAVLVVAGLVFWSLPLALITAGCFLVIVANVPGAARPDTGTPPVGVGPRADRPRKPDRVVPGR
jgi:hypothetical protein